MFKSFFKFVCFVGLIVNAHAQTTQRINQEESKLYTKVADIALNSSVGLQKLSAIYAKTPLIIAPVFSRCSGICSPFLKNLAGQLANYKNVGNYKVVVVSFDPRDKVENMNDLAKFHQLEKNAHWIFATTSGIDSLLVSIGFHAGWDEQKQQFEHEALLVGVNENGFILRKLLGLRDEKAIFSLMDELNHDFVMSYPLPRKNMLFSCFTYNPVTGKTSFSVGLFIMLIPAVLTLVFLFFLGFRKPQKKENPDVVK